MIAKMEEESGDEEAAYRKGKGCPGHLATMQVLIEKLTAWYGLWWRLKPRHGRWIQQT